MRSTSITTNGIHKRIVNTALAFLLGFTTLAIIPGSSPAAHADTGSDSVVSTEMQFSQQAVPPITSNPALRDSCGLDMVLVIDSSGSVGSAAGDIVNAYNALLNGLIGTDSRAGVVDFKTTSSVKVSPYTAITDATVNQSGGAFKTYIDSYSAGGWTNWEEALYDTRTTFSNPDLVVIVTDGNPNTVRGGSGGGASEPQAVQAAMVEANLI
jgi:hypothetical protein